MPDWEPRRGLNCCCFPSRLWVTLTLAPSSWWRWKRRKRGLKGWNSAPLSHPGMGSWFGRGRPWRTSWLVWVFSDCFPAWRCCEGSADGRRSQKRCSEIVTAHSCLSIFWKQKSFMQFFLFFILRHYHLTACTCAISTVEQLLVPVVGEVVLHVVTLSGMSRLFHRVSQSRLQRGQILKGRAHTSSG